MIRSDKDDAIDEDEDDEDDKIDESHDSQRRDERRRFACGDVLQYKENSTDCSELFSVSELWSHFFMPVIHQIMLWSRSRYD